MIQPRRRLTSSVNTEDMDTSQSNHGNVKQRRWRRVIVFVLLAVLVVVAGTPWVLAGRLIAACPNDCGPCPDTLPNGVEISLQDIDNRVVRGWRFQPNAPRGVVVLLHGIRGNRQSMLPRAQMLTEADYATVLVDLHAHGESDGERITLGANESLSVGAAVQFAKQQYSELPIVVLGVSLGGAATLLSEDLDVDAVILESVYPTIEHAVTNRVCHQLGSLGRIPSWMLLAQLNPRLGISLSELRPIDRIGNLGCPVFIISGRDDPHTTLANTESFFAAASEPKTLWIVDEAEHVDLYQFADREYRTRVVAFLETVFD